MNRPRMIPKISPPLTGATADGKKQAAVATAQVLELVPLFQDWALAAERVLHILLTTARIHRPRLQSPSRNPHSPHGGRRCPSAAADGCPFPNILRK